MGLIYGNSCKTPGCTHLTTHPSGYCSRCRRIKGEDYCRICRKVKTSDPSGLCANCQANLKKDDVSPDTIIDNAIKDLQLSLFILERRKENISFSRIGEMVGMSKSAVYGRFLKACKRSGSGNIGVDVDGSVLIDTNKVAPDLAEKLAAEIDAKDDEDQ